MGAPVPQTGPPSPSTSLVLSGSASSVTKRDARRPDRGKAPPPDRGNAPPPARSRVFSDCLSTAAAVGRGGAGPFLDGWVTPHRAAACPAAAVAAAQPKSRGGLHARGPARSPEPPTRSREREAGRARNPPVLILFVVGGGGRGGGEIWVGVARRSAVTPPPVRAHRVGGAQRRWRPAAATPQGGTCSMCTTSQAPTSGPPERLVDAAASGAPLLQRAHNARDRLFCGRAACAGGGPPKCSPHPTGAGARGAAVVVRGGGVKVAGGELRREGGGGYHLVKPPRGRGGGEGSPPARVWPAGCVTAECAHAL